MPFRKIWQAQANDNRKRAAETRRIAESLSLKSDKESLLRQSAQLEQQADELEQYIAAS